MLSAADLCTLRRNLEQRYGQVLSRRVKIHEEKSRPDLLKLRSGGKCSGELAPVDGEWETALSRRGERQYVFPLLPMRRDGTEDGVARCWVGWFETWRCIAKNEFDLQTAAWTLYWGYAVDEIKTQVLRAEWDQLYRLECTPSDAGHPHWHIDTEIALSKVGAAAAHGALEELFDAPESNLAIQRVHLAMGGWLNKQANPTPQPPDNDGVPECWQCDFGGGADDLSTWGVRTLRYLQTQAKLIRTK